MKLKTNLPGHTGYVSTVTVSPDGSLCASGGKDKVAMLWDLNEVRATCKGPSTLPCCHRAAKHIVNVMHNALL